MGDQRHKRAYPDGPVQQITPEWKEAVRAALAKRGVTQAWLADRCGVHKSAITVMLRSETMTSRIVAQVRDVLGVEPPVIGIGKISAEILDLANQLTAESLELTLNMMRSLPKKTP